MVCHAWWLNWDLDLIKVTCSSKSYRRNCRAPDSLGLVKTVACQFVAALLNPLAAPSLVSLHHSSERLEAKLSTPVWSLSDGGRRAHALLKESEPVHAPCASENLSIIELRQTMGSSSGVSAVHLLDRSPISRKKWSWTSSSILIPLHLPHFSAGLRKLYLHNTRSIWISYSAVANFLANRFTYKADSTTQCRYRHRSPFHGRLFAKGSPWKV